MKEPQPKTYFELLADFVSAARRVTEIKRPSVAQLLRKQGRRAEAKQVNALTKAVNALDRRLDGKE